MAEITQMIRFYNYSKMKA